MLPGTFNPIAFGNVNFIGSDVYQRATTGNVDHDFTISGAQAGDLLILALSFDGGGDSSWSFSTASGGTDFTTIYDNTGNSTLGVFVGYAVASGSLLRVQTTNVGSSSWDSLSMVLAVYRGPTTLVASDTTSPLSIANTGSLTILTGHASAFDGTPTAVAPSGYIVAGEESSGGELIGSAVAIAHSLTNVANPSATLDWNEAQTNESFTMALFD